MTKNGKIYLLNAAIEEVEFNIKDQKVVTA
jgi:hypothetical protein